MLLQCQICNKSEGLDIETFYCDKCKPFISVYEALTDKNRKLELELDKAKDSLKFVCNDIGINNYDTYGEVVPVSRHVIKKVWNIVFPEMNPDRHEYDSADSFTHYSYITYNIIFSLLKLFQKKKKTSWTDKEMIINLHKGLEEFIECMKWKDVKIDSVEQFIDRVSKC